MADKPEGKQRRSIDLDGGLMPPPVNLPPPLERKYERNFLSKVVVRLDFAIPITLSDALRKKLGRFCKGEGCPVYEEATQAELEFQMKVGSGESSSSGRSRKLWNFKGDGKAFCVADQFCYIEYLKYESYALLQSQLDGLLGVIVKGEKDLQTKRIGLRYVDHLNFDEPEPTSWDAYLIPAMLGAFEVAEDRSTIARAFSVLEINYGNDVQMRIQYGMMNPDFPAPIQKKIFTIDHDAFQTALTDKQKVCDVLDELRVKAKLSFESVIQPGLRQRMGLKQ